MSLLNPAQTISCATKPLKQAANLAVGSAQQLVDAAIDAGLSGVSSAVGQVTKAASAIANNIGDTVGVTNLSDALKGLVADLAANPALATQKIAEFLSKWGDVTGISDILDSLDDIDLCDYTDIGGVWNAETQKFEVRALSKPSISSSDRPSDSIPSNSLGEDRRSASYEYGPVEEAIGGEWQGFDENSVVDHGTDRRAAWDRIYTQLQSYTGNFPEEYGLGATVGCETVESLIINNLEFKDKWWTITGLIEDGYIDIASAPIEEMDRRNAFVAGISDALSLAKSEFNQDLQNSVRVNAAAHDEFTTTDNVFDGRHPPLAPDSDAGPTDAGLLPPKEIEETSTGDFTSLLPPIE